MRHQACSNCGKYRGKTVLTIKTEAEKGKNKSKSEKKTEAK